ncbi:MAG: AraC family ligand binding domain-containing protein, partial [Chloroflexota bacterium]
MIQDQQQFWRNDLLQFNILDAYHRNYAYPRHSHDHYVISLIQDGVQSFTHKGTKYTTPPNGLIFINPGIVHTGESATAEGFRLRSLYPTLANMEAIAYELTGRHQTIPYFREVRVDHPGATQMVSHLHEAIKSEPDPLIFESQFLSTMTYLVKHFADIRTSEKGLKLERDSVRKARHYLEENHAQTIHLSDLAQHVALSPYHLLRV